MNKLKKLYEERENLQLEMRALLDGATKEERAMNEDEINQFNDKDSRIKQIDATIKAEERARDLQLNVLAPKKKEELTTEELETRAFAAHIRGEILEQRAENLTKSDNGAIIPKTIANKIIETVKELSPIYQLATKYNVKGDLTFPVYDESTQKIQCAYATEFTSLTSHSGKFTSVTLSGFLAGALTKVSRSLINNNDFDLVAFVVRKMAEAIAAFIENECINGDGTSKVTGVLNAKTVITAASGTAITTDELIDVQMSLLEPFQADAVWLMHRDTLKAIRKLKDNDGNYILNRDLSTAFGWTLLGRPIYLSDNMPQMEATNKAIVYGDLSGYYVKMVENMDIQILNEKFADEHAVGVVAWIELDGKPVETQKITVLKMA